MGSFFWGGLGKGIAGGMEKQQELQQKREESKLRTKMIDAQIKHQDAQARMEEAKELRFRKLGETREAAAGSFKEAITGSTPGAPMIEEPGDPAIAPAQIQGQPGAGKIGRPMAPHEIALHAMISDPSHAIPGAAIRALGGPSTSGIDRAFATPQDAMAFMGTPEYKALFPLGGRVQQTSRGWSIIGMNPSDPTANAFHAGLQGPGGRPAAEEARAGMLYGGAANTAAGRELGGAAATMGVPIPPRPPMAGQVPSGPMAPGTPQVAPGPAEAGGGLPLPQAAKQAESRAGAQGKRQVEAQEKLKDIASTEEIINDIEILSNRVNTAAASNPVGRIAGGLKKAAGAFLQTDTDAADLTRLRNSFSLSLARSVLSERGVLTNQDREYATATIPGVYDSKELAQRSIFRLKALTALQRDAEQALAQGKSFDIEAFRAKWRTIAAPSPNAATNPTPQAGRLVPVPRQ